MKFRYVGDKEEMQVFGYDFSGGKITDVTDANAIKKLSGNRFFEAVEEAIETEESGKTSEDEEKQSTEGESSAAETGTADMFEMMSEGAQTEESGKTKKEKR